MVLGQMHDIAAENETVTTAEMEKTHRLKTGALIEASVQSGALLEGGRPEQVACLRDYGRCIGLAFQVTDDILNVEGDPALMGKAAGTDATRSKATYPSLMGLPASKRHARSLVNSALQSLEHFDNRADPLRAIARYIAERRR
jgi:geranylgeranyl diphosphate synthase type II